MRNFVFPLEFKIDKDMYLFAYSVLLLFGHVFVFHYYLICQEDRAGLAAEEERRRYQPLR